MFWEEGRFRLDCGDGLSRRRGSVAWGGVGFNPERVKRSLPPLTEGKGDCVQRRFHLVRVQIIGRRLSSGTSNRGRLHCLREASIVRSASTWRRLGLLRVSPR